MRYTTSPAQRKAVKFASAFKSAEDTIGEITPGYRLVGLTKGQFSLIDMILAVNKQIGPCHAMFSTWTTGIEDAERMFENLQKGNFLSMRILTDRSFPTRQPQYVDKFLSYFGEDSVVCTSTHAKFSLLRNDDFSIVIRGSMNLNRNPRCEQFDIDDDASIYKMFSSYVEEIRESMPAGFAFTNRQIVQSFVDCLGGGISGLYDTIGVGSSFARSDFSDLLSELTPTQKQPDPNRLIELIAKR